MKIKKEKFTNKLTTKNTDVNDYNDNRKPSEVFDVYWLYAKIKTNTYPNATDRCGKWLLFHSLSIIDDAWAKIKIATEEGKLGDLSKVSTAHHGFEMFGGFKPNTKVICVYTYDWKDEDDINRIRKELTNLGYIHKIPYKADNETLEDVYSKNGNKNISKYYK